MATITINSSTAELDFFTLNDGTTDYGWHCSAGSNPDPDETLFLIRMKEYPDAVYEDPGEEIPDRPCQTIEEINTWVTANPTDPVAWVDSFQSEIIDRGLISQDTKDALANATTIAGLRTVLQSIFKTV
ncbi:hypothetical protein KAR91_74495 [Candidatus Pacearchaeota archaeon]|nr:hypothetical protein [Candidatus Pacearchaeota archaeon]